MGKLMFDLWSYGHFLQGYLSRIIIFPNNIWFGFILSNIIHGIIEFSEKEKTPNGKVLETKKNKIGDTICFNIGWLLAYITSFKKINKYVYVLLCLILLIGYLEQFLREIFPNTDLYFTIGAYLPYKYKYV